MGGRESQLSANLRRTTERLSLKVCVYQGFSSELGFCELPQSPVCSWKEGAPLTPGQLQRKDYVLVVVPAQSPQKFPYSGSLFYIGPGVCLFYHQLHLDFW